MNIGNYQDERSFEANAFQRGIVVKNTVTQAFRGSSERPSSCLGLRNRRFTRHCSDGFGPSAGRSAYQHDDRPLPPFDDYRGYNGSNKNLYQGEIFVQKRFCELVSAFLRQAEIDCPVVPGENIVTVPMGDLSVRICLLEKLGAAVFQGIVGIVPESDLSAAGAELLRMNSLFRRTGGAAYGLEGDAVTIQSFVLLEGVTEEGFAAQAVCFLEALAEAVESFDQTLERARAGAVSASSEVSDDALLGMIRI